MLKIVVDTNVMVSGSVWSGSPSKVLDLIEEDEVTLCVSEKIIEEYWEVFTRGFLPEEARIIIRSILERKQVLLVSPQRHFTLIEDDPDDNIFIDCAVGSGAEYIITGDKHLLNLGKFENIEILSPDAFMKKI